MSHKKLLTISIPTWNRSNLIKELLDELIAQVINYNLSGEIEILVSNNGSEDNTHEVLKELLTKYSFITYNRNPVNIGANPNVMKSMQMASSEYLIFLGDDDRIKGGSLSGVIDFLKTHQDAGVVIDSSDFKKKTEEQLTLPFLLRNYYWNIGNAGVFVVKSSYVKECLNKYGAAFFNQCWSQSQFMILGLHEHKDDKIYIRDLNIVSLSVHQEVTIYNSFYLWRVGYYELFAALKSMENILDKKNLQPAYAYMKDNIYQFALFNILQFGIFVDSEEIRLKTRQHILKNIHIFSLYEKTIFYLIVFALWIPHSISKLIADIFIYLLRGRAGILKKNEFVTREKEKKLKAEQMKSIAIRKLEFETDNY